MFHFLLYRGSGDVPSQADSSVFLERGKWKNFRLEGSLGSACYPLCRLVGDNLRGVAE